ncbi:hypothetical protein B0H17DRAFT_1178100 [Mycena rosella]|uniref:Uncharacterized protein n=1 Tax=Mycena rosella TaxID=1033263 RepID=A0AAD7DNJ7_MYCRO|nr:hypothetical protein B0H17DRAFT_1178100 [Mycena rosella]
MVDSETPNPHYENSLPLAPLLLDAKRKDPCTIYSLAGAQADVGRVATIAAEAAITIPDAAMSLLARIEQMEARMKKNRRAAVHAGRRDTRSLHVLSTADPEAQREVEGNVVLQYNDSDCPYHRIHDVFRERKKRDRGNALSKVLPLLVHKRKKRTVNITAQQAVSGGHAASDTSEANRSPPPPPLVIIRTPRVVNK